nr:MAG TPA: hypothetical protein [Caudoviricetes sp.]
MAGPHVLMISPSHVPGVTAGQFIALSRAIKKDAVYAIFRCDIATKKYPVFTRYFSNTSSPYF